MARKKAHEDLDENLEESAAGSISDLTNPVQIGEKLQHISKQLQSTELDASMKKALFVVLEDIGQHLIDLGNDPSTAPITV